MTESTKSHSGAPKTIPEFCEYYKFGKSTFYGLAKRKLAPKTMRIGRAVRISAAAEQEWVARMEAGEAAHVPEFASKPPGCGDKSSDTDKRQKKRRSKDRSHAPKFSDHSEKRRDDSDSEAPLGSRTKRRKHSTRRKSSRH
jgi:predicted DNA-binding transcriptional regulator AlpA